jgi:uncharacterized protein YwqG
MKVKEPFIPLSLVRLSVEILSSYTPFLRISPKTSSENLGSTQSKLLGNPYWPISTESYPRDLNGQLMRMIAQINLDDIQKAIGSSDLSSYFPQKGILQFFIPNIFKNNNYWGQCSDNKANSFNDIKIIYHETTCLPDSLPKEIKEYFKYDSNVFPISQECELKFSLDYEFCSLTDEYHSQYYYHQLIDNLCPYEEKEFYGAEEFDSSGCKMLGYAHFCQSDPRTDEYNEENPWLLLLQIDSFMEGNQAICSWVDNGVGNWFIRKNDLLNLDFSKVYFYWDCY